MTRVGFLVHPERPEATKLAYRAQDWLESHGHQWCSVGVPGPDLTNADHGTSNSDNLGVLDLLVSLGGDGTMLRAIELATPVGVPVLGVNLGRLGYLTEVEPAGLEKALQGFLDGAHQVEERMTLSVTVTDPDGILISQRLALNEAVVEKTVPGHTVRVAATIDGTPFVTYAADGLLVATPTGSTAYNLSARGPVVSPRLRALIVTPVSPHMLFDRALVLEASQRLTLTVLEPRPAVVVIDGATIATVLPASTIETCAGARSARLVTFGTRDFSRHPQSQVSFG